MAWSHPVATVVIDATDQQRFGFGPCDRVSVALLVELGLHRVKEITIEDGGLLAGEDLALEGDLADVEPITQKMGERAAGEWDAANRAPGLERSYLGDDPPLAKVGHQQVEAAKLQIPPEDSPDPFSLLFNHDDLAVLGLISEGGYVRLEAAILSRMRSEVTSRSNWANDNRTLSVSRPMEVVVLNCWVTETKDTPWPSNSSTSLAKSASERVRRSTL